MASGDVTLLYSANTSALTITLASLANAAAQQCTAYVNSGSSFTDGSLIVKLTSTTGTHGSDLVCYLYGYCSPDNTNWTDPVTTSSDLAVTITTGMNLIGPAVVNFGTSATGTTTRTVVIPSVANFFGGQLPARFGFVVENKLNIGLASAAASQAIIFCPTYENVAP